MAVRETQLNPEQKAKEQSLQYEEEKEFATRLSKSMDLPSTLTEGIRDAEKKALQEPQEVEEEEAEEETEEPEEHEETEEEPKAEEESEESEEEDEDLIPKSKVQKRFDELTAQLKELKNELKKERESKAAEPRDTQQEQLEAMSVSELEVLKDQVELEKLKSYKSDNLEEFQKLRQLEKKIDGAIKTAPTRFSQTQINRFNSAVQETAESMEGFDSVKAEIFNHAKAIYDSSPELQKSISGQERAWKFAVDHFTALKKVTEGKSDTTELKRQVNTLKKKISVDSSSKKAVQQPDSIQRNFKKAVHGDDSDKLNYMKRRLNTDSFVTEDELRNFQQ